MKNTMHTNQAVRQNLASNLAKSRPSLVGRMVGILGLVLLLGPAAQAQTILDSTGSYAVMGGGVVTVTGVGTTLTGDLGAGSLVGTVTYGATGSQVTPLTAQNLTDFNRAYAGLDTMTMSVNLTGQGLGAGANNLTPGVYLFTSAAAMTGNLVLDAQFQSNAVWVFQMDSTFNTTANTSVTIINSAGNSADNYGIFWQVGGAAVFGANTLFLGNMLSASTIDLGAGVQVDGRLLTATGTIGLATDTIDFIAADSGYSGGLGYVDSGSTLTAVPEPATYALIAGLVMSAAVVIRRRRASVQG